MSLLYVIGDSGNAEHRFVLDYRKLQGDFERISSYSDQQFLQNIPEVLHYAMIVAYLKNIPTEVLCSDVGLLHELVHCLNPSVYEEHELKEAMPRIRHDFKNLLALAK